MHLAARSGASAVFLGSDAPETFDTMKRLLKSSGLRVLQIDPLWFAPLETNGSRSTEAVMRLENNLAGDKMLRRGKDEGLALLAQVFLSAQSHAFVGTVTSNLGRLVHLLMPTAVGERLGAFDVNCKGLVSMETAEATTWAQVGSGAAAAASAVCREMRPYKGAFM
jgi:hypothetical protein